MHPALANDGPMTDVGPLITDRLVLGEAQEQDLPGMLEVARSNPWFLYAHEAHPGAPDSLTAAMVAADIVAARLDPLRHPLVIRKRGSDLPGSTPSAEHGTVVGWAETLDDHPSDHAPWIGLLELHADVQGRGFGQEAALALIGWYRQHGHERLLLGVDDGNDRAAAFWGNLGFTRIDRRPRISAAPSVDVDVLELRLTGAGAQR